MDINQKRLVNLFVVGAMKSGSTTLHDYLAEHPEIFMSPEKEPGFFVPELWRSRGAGEYEALFSNARDEKYLGESSTHYTKLPSYSGVAERIHQYNPRARILYIMRHPVKRTVSHYLHNRRDLSGYAENRPMLKAIAQDAMYSAYSNYALQIGPYYDLFGRDQVFVVLFEEMVAFPETVLRGVFQWLDVDSNFIVAGCRKSNATPAAAPMARGFGLLNKLRYSSQWARFSPYMPKLIKNLGNAMAEKVETVAVADQEIVEVQAMLEPVFREYVRDLEALTGKSFAVWNL